MLILKLLGFSLLTIFSYSFYLNLLFKLVFAINLVLKLLVKLLVKLLGFLLFNIFNYSLFIKLYFIISVLLVILYYLLSLYFLYKFRNQDVKIPRVLPNFIISWLEDIQFMSKTNQGFKSYKDMMLINLSLLSNNL